MIRARRRPSAAASRSPVVSSKSCGSGFPPRCRRATIAPVGGRVEPRSRPGPQEESTAPVPNDPHAKFFVNAGVVSSRIDMQHVLRPILKQTVTYRYHRGRELVAHGTGWVERIVVDQPDVSTFFTPIAITINIDSFEHLEFETRPDQLLVYRLVHGDERIVLEFAPVGALDSESPLAPRQLAFDTSGYVQMELLGLDTSEAE